ncbi:maltase A3 [Drosophila virilis]|uniref:alpha-glucosidase n=1 Tax=Drosophila virilis TaxID=7244 RepID=B4LLB7_DROVI|nr:maltase A3 [Drosophila virilis]EDW60854.1 maltase A5 [Drosophila virilis]
MLISVRALLMLLLLQYIGPALSQPYPNYHADFVDIDHRRTEPKWWQTGAFYQIYPRSFKDSNGDGVGDLNGIADRLPYLKELGITATWLSPIFSSPMADFGYDIANFTEIAPIFGTMSDFERLMKTAKQLDMKIILDFVPNHSSDECDWFKRSVAGEAEYKDFYVWHAGRMVNGTRQPPSNWLSVFRGSAWEWHETRKEYYLHQFLKKQPDLNYRNPKVRETMKNVLRFWLAKGVAGFRIDAVPSVFEIAPDAAGQYRDEPRNDWVNDPDDYGYLQHIYTVDQPETLAMVYEWRAVLDEFKDGDERILLAETYSPIDIVMQYYGNATAEGAQLPFNFLLITEISNKSNAVDYAQTIQKWLQHMPQGRTANWVLGNHDQSRVGSRLGADRVDMLNMLITTLPGASVTYQGEELGMTDVWISWKDTVDPSACNTNASIYEHFSRDPERTPFQWSGDADAGFSNASKTWLPIAGDYKQVNVDQERQQPQSHLNIYKDLLQLKRTEKTMQLGNIEVKALSGAVLAVKRFRENDFTYVTLLNIFDGFETVNLNQSFSDLTAQMKVVLVSGNSKRKVDDLIDSSSLQLLPKESLILRSTSTYYTYYVNGEHRKLPVLGIYLVLAQVALYLNYCQVLALNRRW